MIIRIPELKKRKKRKKKIQINVDFNEKEEQKQQMKTENLANDKKKINKNV